MSQRIKIYLDTLLDPSLYEYGFADIRGLVSEKYSGYTHAISIIRKLDSAVIDGIKDGPTEEYYSHYNDINTELNALVKNIAELTASFGFSALAIPATVEDKELDSEYFRTLSYPFSHKMAGTRSGLGWIGKTDLFISKRFGPRIRLATVLVDAPLEQLHPPIETSQCGKCSLCQDICPAHAANGLSWNKDLHRNEFFDPFKCRTYCRAVSDKLLHKEISLCGKCVYICPYGTNTK